MIIEQSFDYPVLKESLDDSFLEMVEYSVSLYQQGKIINDSGDLIKVDDSDIDLSMLDLDAVRWWIGLITVNEYLKSIDIYYKRKNQKKPQY